MKKIALIGYSGHSYVVAEVLLQCNYRIIGYFEKFEKRTNPFNLVWLGSENKSTFLNDDNLSVSLAIGDNKIRSNIFNKFQNENPNIGIPFVISPKSIVSKYSSINKGTIVCQGAIINPLSIIGCGVIVNTGSIIEHECNISDFVHIAPGAVLAGNVSVGKETFVGANAVIKQGISIGEKVVVGAGAVVLKNISDNEIWAGNPAKRIG